MAPHDGGGRAGARSPLITATCERGPTVRHIGRSLLLAAGIALLHVPAAMPTPALAATFTVDSTADEPDASPGDSVCRSTITSRCTLRAAIMETNALAGPDTITLPSDTYRLTVSGVDDAAAMGDLDISRD